MQIWHKIFQNFWSSIYCKIQNLPFKFYQPFYWPWIFNLPFSLVISYRDFCQVAHWKAGSMQIFLMYSKSHEMASLFNERDFSRIFKVLWQTVGHLKIDFWNQGCHVQKCKNNEFFVCFSAKCLSLVTLGLLSKVATRLSKWVGPPKLLFLRMIEAIKRPHFLRANSLDNL